MPSTGPQHRPGATPTPAVHGPLALAGRAVPYHLPPPVPLTTSPDLPSNRHPRRANPNSAADDQVTSADLIGEPVRRTDDYVLSRLTAIDHRLDQVSTQLSTVLSQLQKICATLETLSPHEGTVIARKAPAGYRSSDAPVRSPGGQPVPEGEALTELLAEVVLLAGQRALFPGRLDEIAERAQEHHSVRRALRSQQ